MINFSLSYFVKFLQQMQQTATHIFSNRSYLKTLLSANFIIILQEINFIVIFAYKDNKTLTEAAVQGYAIVALKKWINSIKLIGTFDCTPLILMKTIPLQGSLFLKSIFSINSKMLTIQICHSVKPVLNRRSLKWKPL